MKRSLLAICFIIASLTGFAQLITYGVKAGVNFATLHSTFDRGPLPNFRAATLYNAGLFADYKWDRISLQPSLNITGKGSKTIFVLVDENHEDGTSGYYKNSFTYLELPVNIVYHIPFSKGNIYFGAGPYIAYMLSNSFSVNVGGTSTSESNNDDYPNPYNKTEFGVNAIAGVNLPGGILFNVNYDKGLTNISKENSGSLTTSTIGLSVGYIFK